MDDRVLSVGIIFSIKIQIGLIKLLDQPASLFLAIGKVCPLQFSLA